MRTPHSRRTASRHAAYAITALVGLAIAAPALADWPPTYTIERIGLQGPDYDASSLFQHDFIRVILDSGSAVGETKRDNGGTDIWLWDGETTHLLGFTDSEHTGSSGYRYSQYRAVNQDGQVLGLTPRILGIDTINGSDPWVWDGNSTLPLGFTGSDYIGSAGYRQGVSFFQNESGQITGYQSRILDVNTSNGNDAWVWNDGVTQQIGLLGGIYEGSAGYRNSSPLYQNQSNQITGNSKRIAAVNTDLGQDTWIWNNATTQQIGLAGGAYTDSNNYQYSRPLLQNDAGFVAGYSTRYDESLADFGQSAWVWDGSVTHQIGLTGPEYTGTTGFQSSTPFQLTASGLVAGNSVRVLDENTPNGADGWVWDGTSTRRPGPTGPEYTGSNGYRSSSLSVTSTGRVLGRTARITGVDTNNGYDGWVVDGDSLQLLGLFGPEYTGASGYRDSSPFANDDSEYIVGQSKRILGDSTYNGEDWWAWDGASMRVISLTGPEYTGSNGYRRTFSPSVWHESAQGKARGETWRITGVNTQNGKDVWWYDGATTHLLGLTGPEYTGSNGYRNSSIFMQNAANQIVGTTSRIINVSSQVSSVAWYFDPATGITTPIIASVGPEGTYPSSSAGYLTDDGYLLGSFTYFVPGTGATESHAYVFRPDIGIIDVSTHIEGGVAANGWRSVHGIVGAASYHTIFGNASRLGSDSGSRAFVLRAPIEPACPVCPADYDQDGGVSGSDIAAFFSDFEQGAPCADVDLDGGVTGADLSTFFASYELGGC